MNEKPGERATPQEFSAAPSELPATDGRQPQFDGATAAYAAAYAAAQPPQDESTYTMQPAVQGVDPRNLRPKTGPIVWGVLVLAFCLYTTFQVWAPGWINGTTFVIGATIGLGLLLLAVGAGVIVRNSRSSRR